MLFPFEQTRCDKVALPWKKYFGLSRPPKFCALRLDADVLRCCGEDGVFGDVGRVVAYALERARD
jgi:hypothetical protein